MSETKSSIRPGFTFQVSVHICAGICPLCVVRSCRTTPVRYKLSNNTEKEEEEEESLP